MGADVIINSGKEDVEKVVKELTNGLGCDTVIEAVGKWLCILHCREPESLTSCLTGIPATFEMCQNLVGFGGTIANIGKRDQRLQQALTKC